jgi:hypothetical protein
MVFGTTSSYHANAHVSMQLRMMCDALPGRKREASKPQASSAAAELRRRRGA